MGGVNLFPNGFLTLAMDEVSCQLHAPTTSAAGKEDTVLNE